MGLRPLEIFLLSQCGDRINWSESDVYRRQILTTKVYSRAVMTKGTSPPPSFSQIQTFPGLSVVIQF